MLRLLRPLIIGLSLLLSLAALADDVAIPALEHRVTDLTGSLSADQQTALESKLAQFEQTKGSQIAVLLVPSTKPEEIEQYSIRVAEAWKIGRKKVDDGVLLLVAKDDRKLRIEVGYGLEGAIPDAYAKRIIAEVIAPHFKQGDIAGGLNAGVDAIIGLISGEQLPAPAQSNAGGEDQIDHYLPLLIFGGLISAIFLRTIFGRFLGGVVNGGLIGVVVWLLTAALGAALVFGVIAFLFTLMAGGNGIGVPGFGGGSGGSGGFGGGNDSFSGGGGGFGGGGASGDW